VKLYNIVKAKTGYIPPEQWKEAIDQIPNIELPEGFGDMTEEEQLQYIANSMAVWIINNKGEKK
jgi:hypothetical protein